MESASPLDETVVDDPWARALYWLLFPLLGAGVGWLAVWGAPWVADLPWAPFQGVFSFLGRAPDLVGVAVGLVLGLVVAGLAHADMLVVRLGTGAVTLTRGGKRRTVARGDITAAFLDGKELVLLGRDATELAREKTDLPAKEIAAAFTAKGYPWRPDGDPHRDEFRMWTRADDDLPGVAHGLLDERAKALEKGKADEAATIRAELLKLGVVVRDEKKRQFWRRDRRALP